MLKNATYYKVKLQKVIEGNYKVGQNGRLIEDTQANYKTYPSENYEFIN